jgi:hypothetical protein
MEEVVVVAFADGDVIAILNDRRIVGDLLHAAVNVAAAAHPAVAGVKMGDDVDLVIRARMKMDGAGAGRDGDVGGAAYVERAVKAGVGREGGGTCQGEYCGGGGKDFNRHGSSSYRLELLRFRCYPLLKRLGSRCCSLFRRSVYCCHWPYKVLLYC